MASEVGELFQKPRLCRCWDNPAWHWGLWEAPAATAGLSNDLVSQTVLPSQARTYSKCFTWHVLVQHALGNIQQYGHNRVPGKLVLPSAELTTNEFPRV